MPYTLMAKFPKQQTVFISLQISSHLLVLKFKQAAKSLPDTWGEQKLKLTEKELGGKQNNTESGRKLFK